MTEELCRSVDRKPGAFWWVALLLSAAAFAVGLAAIWEAILVGMGVWGINRTVGWGFDITNFVFWIGIGHAGTMISAVLFLFRQEWRTAINRAAEAMTVFAVACAAVYPLVHMGRPWFFYWLVPYPNNRGPLWANFRSPLLWDFSAILTYFTISFVFWYVGMLPDLATLRDRARAGWQRSLFGFLALGWNGSARDWNRYESIYAFLALLATPMVVAVCAIVSFNFATSVIPGWHTTIFPPYFLVGAIFCGFALVLMLLLVTRRALGLEAYITGHHLNWLCKGILLGSFAIGLIYAVEFFIAWYSANPYELSTFINRAIGPYAWAYWTMVSANVVVPQVLWLRWARRTPWVMFGVALLVVIGMWCERFVIVVTSLHRDYLPGSWSFYVPSLNEILILAGMFGLFFGLFLLFARYLPVIPIAEMKVALATPPEGGERSGAEHPAVGAWSSGRRTDVRNRARAGGAADRRYCTGYFSAEHDLLGAVREARRRGYVIADAFTPYPVHGLPAALGLRPSRLPWVAFWAGALVLGFSLAMQVWTSAYNWPLRVGGQPFNAGVVWMPTAIMLAVLSAGLVGVCGLLVRTRLWPGKRTSVLPGVTNDRYALVLQETDASVDLEEMVQLLREHRAVEIAEGDEPA